MSARPDVDLSSLRDAAPPPAVTRRIVAGALERSSPRPSRWMPLVPAGAAFAAGLAIAFLLFRPLEGGIAPEPAALAQPTPAVTPPALVPAPAPEVPRLETGSPAQASAAPASFRAGRLAVRLEPGARVLARRVEPRAVVVEVTAGMGRFQVEALQADELFHVTARELTVLPVGARLDVEVEVEGDCTRVAVPEGVVKVRRAGREELLTADRSRTFCSGEATGVRDERLSEEDLMLFEALEAVRAGGDQDLARAVASLTEYQRRFPDGLYLQEALYYLARLHHRLGHPAESRAWAGRFLQRFPTGRRADELRPLVAQ